MTVPVPNYGIFEGVSPQMQMVPQSGGAEDSAPADV